MAIQNRIRELRKSMSMSQVGLSLALGTTQQAISRMENSPYDIPSDLLVKMSKFFNVTTDYILGISDIKHNVSGHARMDREMDKYYSIVLRYQQLSEINRRTFMVILDRLEQAQHEGDEVKGNIQKEEDTYAEDSSM